MDRRAALEDAIREDPDDAGRYLALGDLLQIDGDPRGELIALQQAGRPETTAAAEAWLAAHPELGGEIAECELAWEHGFVRAAQLDASPGDGVAALGALLASPSTAFLRELRILVGNPS